MANGKVWTNADVRRHERETLAPGDPRLTQEGPWRTTGRPDALAGMDAGAGMDVDAAIREAKETIQSNSNFAATRDADARDRSQSFQPATMRQRVGNALERYTPDVLTKLAFPIARAATLPTMANPAVGLPVAALAGLEHVLAPEASMGQRALGAAAAIPAVGGAARALGLGGRLSRGAEATIAAQRLGPKAKRAAQDQAWMRRFTGQSEEVPYHGGWSDAGTAGHRYQPSAYRQAMNGPEPNLSVVDDVPVAQSRPTMSEVDELIGGSPRNESMRAMDRLVDESPMQEAADLELQRLAASRSRLNPNGRVPMGRTGNEYEGIKPFGKAEELSPEEMAEVPGFWDDIIEQYFGRR